MAGEQLTIYGKLEPYPLRKPRRLTERQRNLVRYMRFWVAMKHNGAAFPTREASLYYADPAGALRRLEALGLVARVARGKWVATP